MRIRRVVPIAFVMLGACGGDKPGGPDVATGGFGVGGSIALAEPIPRATGPIQEAHLLLDGRVVARREVSPGASMLILDFEERVESGRHTVAVRIVRQTVNPGTYRVLGGVAVVRIGSNSSQTFQFPDEEHHLRTGDMLSLSFDVRP
ncbi:MAG TPA: hypothetical protein VFZ21_20255 [Gemmatimonadaceae bacterium]|jgi:hypothetical protein|nr:hypothetical protein [Gemmatimonadaceae bacterium]